MEDINIIIRNAFGREIKASTEQIEEDVLQMRMGLKLQKQDGGIMKELRVVIAGSRDFDDLPKLISSCANILSDIINRRNDLDKIRVVSGTAKGADQLGEQYAKIAGYEVTKFYPDWNGLGKKAGYVRNTEMAKYAVANGNYGVLIAFWDGKSKGTKHMIDLAKKNNLEVYIVRFDDEEIRE